MGCDVPTQTTYFYAFRYQLTCQRLDLALDVTESDLETMCKCREMASTWTMTLFTLWMEYSLPLEVTERFTVVDPLWVTLHQQTMKGQAILRKVAECDFMFIPIVLDGHWVLWTKMRQKVSKLTSKVVFCDPLNNAATDNVRRMAELAIREISSEPLDHTIVPEGQHHVLHIPTQPNCWDCGFYVMKTIQMLVGEFLQGWISPTFVSVIAMPYSCGLCIDVFLYIFGDRAQRCGSPNAKWIHFGFMWTSGHEGY